MLLLTTQARIPRRAHAVRFCDAMRGAVVAALQPQAKIIARWRAVNRRGAMLTPMGARCGVRCRRNTVHDSHPSTSPPRKQTIENNRFIIIHIGG